MDKYTRHLPLQNYECSFCKTIAAIQSAKSRTKRKCNSCGKTVFFYQVALRKLYGMERPLDK
jgi:hypothetical protein